MKKALRLALAGTLLVGSLAGLTGCGGSDKPVVYVYNWGDYIDEEVNRMFEEETGIKVVYEVYPTNEDMFAKLSAGGSNYDVLFPSDYMVEKMIKEDMLATIDTSLLTNYEKIDSEFKGLSYDPENKYGVPYLWGTMGIVYNTTMIDEQIDEWADMWNPKYEKQVFVYDSEREALMLALKKLNYSMNAKDSAQLEEAKQELIALKPNVLAYVGDEGKGKMENGEAAMMLAWAGDAMLMTENNPDLAYVIPKEGTNLFVDAMVIPKNAPNIENAHKYIDFLCRPDIAALNAEYVGYSTPISEARELLPEEIKNSEIAYPDTALFDTMEMFNDPGEMIEVYSRIWTEVKAAK
ncbi:MAG: ABC transporter substrate-binding protein [Cellulosilyticaceae bacterium]